MGSQNNRNIITCSVALDRSVQADRFEQRISNQRFVRQISLVGFVLVWVVVFALMDQVKAQTFIPNPMEVPQNHRLPTSSNGSLKSVLKGSAQGARNRGSRNGLSGEFPRSALPGYRLTPERKKVPARSVKYAQDDDLFGEKQVTDADDFFNSEPNKPTPRAAAPRMRQPRNMQPPKKSPLKRNPFGETITPIPDIDPTGPSLEREPRVPQRRPSMPNRRTTQEPGQPRLPADSAFTPDPDSIPDLPTPGGRVRSTEKARTAPPRKNKIDDFDNLEMELEEFEAQERESSDSQVRDNSTQGVPFRRRPNGTNVYRPAPDPSYYSKPTDERLEAYQKYAELYFEQYGTFPPGYAGPNGLPAPPNFRNPYAANPYGGNPYAANPYAASPYGPYGNQNYAANPNMPAVPGYGCVPCPKCPPCQSSCNCQPNGIAAVPLGQRFHDPASTSYSSQVANDVYSGVVCDGREIETVGGAAGCGDVLPGASRLNGDGPLLYYTSIFGGWTGLDDLMLGNDEGNVEIGNDDGVALGFAFGQIQGRNLRSEFEFTYRSNDLEGMTLRNIGGESQFFSGIGSIDSVSGMLNVFWDFVDAPTDRFTPYLGGGIGGISANADFQIDGFNRIDDGNATSLAYQWIAGVNYRTNQLANLFVEYRYFAADSLHFNTTLPASAIIDGDGELEYRTSNILFGMRMKF